MEHILDAHYEATADRCRTAEVALMLQDTTVLNDSTLKTTEGLVPIGGGGTGSRGLLAHAGLAVTPQGLPLGLFSMETRFRDEPDSAGTTGTRQAHTTERHRWIAGLRRAREVAAVCPDTRVVTVCDREGDFWALLAEADRQGDALLVRASRSARRQVLTATGDRACELPPPVRRCYSHTATAVYRVSTTSIALNPLCHTGLLKRAMTAEPNIVQIPALGRQTRQNTRHRTATDNANG